MRPSSITKELVQEQPFPTPDQEAVVALLRTADSVYRAVGAVTGIEGLSMEQYNVLRILRGAGPKGIATLEISKRMIQRDPGITRLLDKLEKKNFVRRERCAEDRRKVMCWTTQAGLECLERLNPTLAPVVKRCLAGFTRAQRTEFLKMLTQIRKNEG